MMAPVLVLLLALPPPPSDSGGKGDAAALYDAYPPLDMSSCIACGCRYNGIPGLALPVLLLLMGGGERRSLGVREEGEAGRKIRDKIR